MLKGAVEHLSGDAAFADLIRRVGPCRLRVDRKREPFDALVRSVTFQQLNGTAAQAIYDRFVALFDDRPTPKKILAASIEHLRSVGLSGSKAISIKDIAAKTQMGIVPNRAEAMRLSDEELVQRLTTIRGVGPWTVEMLLIFTLGRRDVLPVTDFGVRKGFARTYGHSELPAPKILLQHGEAWRPFRSIASWYLWRAADAP